MMTEASPTLETEEESVDADMAEMSPAVEAEEDTDLTDADTSVATIIDDLSRQLQNEKIANSLSLVDITFTCKVCSRKEKSLEDLVVHMKDGKCTTVKRGRGRPKKSEVQPTIKKEKTSPKPQFNKVQPKVQVNQCLSVGTLQSSERVTRVKSGAIKRKSVMEMFDIKQEPDSNEEDVTMDDLYDKEYVQRKKKTKLVKVHSEGGQYITINKSQTGDLVKRVSISGTDTLKANKEAKLYGKEVRIPIGSFKEGQSKIIALKTSTQDSTEPLKGSILQIREIDKKAVVEVLEEDEKEDVTANTTIYLKTVPKKDVVDEETEADTEEGKVNTEEVTEAEKDGEELTQPEDQQDGEVNSENDEEQMYLQELQFAKVGPLLLSNNDDKSESDQQQQLSENSGKRFNLLSMKRRKYNRLPGSVDYDVKEAQLDGGFKCRRCVQRWFFTQTELDVHTRLHKPSPEVGYQCDKCDYNCDIWGRMMYHIIKHPDYLQQLQGTTMMKNVCGTFVCPVCKKVFDKKSKLSSHYNKMHIHEHKICPVCEETFDAMNDVRFERHMDKCKGEEMQCDFCPYKTSIRSNMRVHLRVHSGEGFTCDVCSKVFPTKQRWQIHLQKHSNDRQRYPCEICGSDFCSTDAVKKHIQRMHTEKAVVYRCPVCSYTTLQEADFKKHMKSVHEKKFKCAVDNCEFRTNREDNLEAHKEYHNPDRIYRCNYANCYHAYSNPKNLEGHMHGIHKVGCKHQCPICMKFFKKKTVLLRHLVSHTSERPYNCQECWATFTCHSTYYRHRAKTGHDARREGVASVPQNITIQYVETGERTPPQPTVTTTSVDFDNMAAMAQQVLRQENDSQSSNLISSLDNEVITLDASQFAQLQRESLDEDGNMIGEGNVTYYVYNNDDMTVDDPGSQLLVMTENKDEKDSLDEEQQALIQANTAESAQPHLVEAIHMQGEEIEGVNLEEYNNQFINLDLPNGPALVKVDGNGSFTVINSHQVEEPIDEQEQNIQQEQAILSSSEGNSNVIDQETSVPEGQISQRGNDNKGVVAKEEESEEVIYQEVDFHEYVEKNEVLNIIGAGEDGEQFVVVQGESDAALSMLQLQGGTKLGADGIQLQVGTKSLEGSILHLQDLPKSSSTNLLPVHVVTKSLDGKTLHIQGGSTEGDILQFEEETLTADGVTDESEVKNVILVSPKTELHEER